MLITAALLLTACNMGATPAPTVDVNAINTAAVATAMGQLSAQFTQTALAAPTSTTAPTNTAASLPTFSLSTTTGTAPTSAGALPTTSGALPTFSFNSTPVAGFTQLASPAAPVGGATQSLGDSCNNSAFEADVTIEDWSVLKPGVNFQKVWAVKNTGTCTWDEGYALVYIGGSNPNLDPYDFEFKQSSDFVPGGSSVNLALELTTPCTPGKYEGHWRMRSDSGYYFGTILSVYVEVKDKC
jgi:hypothetical protein